MLNSPFPLQIWGRQAKYGDICTPSSHTRTPNAGTNHTCTDRSDAETGERSGGRNICALINPGKFQIISGFREAAIYTYDPMNYDIDVVIGADLVVTALIRRGLR
jgi:hypothetical protein